MLTRGAVVGEVAAQSRGPRTPLAFAPLKPTSFRAGRKTFRGRSAGSPWFLSVPNGKKRGEENRAEKVDRRVPSTSRSSGVLFAVGFLRMCGIITRRLPFASDGDSGVPWKEIAGLLAELV